MDDPPRVIRYGNRMRLNLESAAGQNLIRAYAPGEVRIGERTFRSSVVVAANTLLEAWRPRSAAELEPPDLEPVLDLAPEVLLLGTGARQQFPSREVLARLYGARVGFEVMDTGAACRTYNVLLAEGRVVVAALIV